MLLRKKYIAILILILFKIPTAFGQVNLDSLQEVWNDTNLHDTIRLQALNKIAWDGYLFSQPDSAFYFAQMAYKFAESKGLKKQLPKALNTQGASFYLRNDYAVAIDYYTQGLIIEEEMGNKNGIASSFNNIGNVYFDQDNYASAIDYYTRSFSIYEEIESKQGMANSLCNIGNIHYVWGNYTSAIDHYIRSLSVREEMGDKRGIANSLSNIGNIYYNQGDYTNALAYYTRDLTIREEIGDKWGIAISLNNIGNVYYHKGDYTNALDYLTRSLTSKEKMGDKNGIATTLSNIGLLYWKKGDYTLAMDYYTRSLTIMEKTGDKNEIANSLISIGMIHKEQGNYANAIEYCSRGLAMAQKIGAVIEVRNAANELYNIYKAIGRHKQALEMYELYIERRDSIYNVENVKKITSMEMQYNFDKEKELAALERQKKEAVQEEKAKQQQALRNSLIAGFALMTLLVLVVLYSFIQKRKANRILGKQKLIIERDNKALKELNATKDKFFSIIAHDLRGPLGNLCTIGELLWQENNSIKIETKKTLQKSLIHGAKESFNLLDNLLKWACSNSGGIEYKPKRILVNDVINENFIFHKVSAESKKITFKSSMDENLYVYADYDMISTVVRNLFSNAIKFTPNNGVIEIFAKNDYNGKIKIGVSDSGVGMSNEVLGNLFRIESAHTTFGTNNEKGTGLGLKLCKEFVEKNRGTISAESEVGVGTVFWISLPSDK